MLVIRANPLFLESSRLLLKHPDIIWVGATSVLTTAQKEIVRLHPDTTIFEKTEGCILADVMEIPEVGKWDMRIIRPGLDNNEMTLYQREHHLVV